MMTESSVNLPMHGSKEGVQELKLENIALGLGVSLFSL